MRAKLLTAVLGVSLISASLATSVARADMAEDAIKYRQAVFTAFRWHFGAMGAMVRGKVDYDAEQFAHHATQFAALTRMPKEGFIEGSDFGDTEAKAELWENMDDVSARFDKLMVNADALLAATGGSLDDVKGAFGAVGKSCKGCHDNYREE
ncbi:MAG: cytochrome c [Oceanospirillaceae bacterium]|nr:cytochrome c [Oceanospirillaceae bacterium]